MILFPVNKLGFFSSSKFFSNIKNFNISYKFDPISDHFNSRLKPFFKYLKLNNDFDYEYPKIIQKKVSSIKNLEKSIIICPFKTEVSMKWPSENFIELIFKIKKVTNNVF